MTQDPKYDAIVERLEALDSAVGELSRRLEAVEQSLADSTRPKEEKRLGSAAPIAHPAAVGEKKPLLGGMSEVFARLAWVCFLLVVALLLRTLAASDLMGLGFGVWTGIGYAAALTAAGWILSARGSKHGGTCAVTGVLLLGSVLAEATLRHQMLSGVTAYGVLILVAAGSVWGARAAGAGALWLTSVVLLGLGISFIFGAPHFPLLALLALVVNVAAGRHPQRRVGAAVLRAVLWLGLVAVWSYWALQVSAAVHNGAAPPPGLHTPWFGPLLLLTVLYFLASAVVEAARLRESWVDTFDACVLPLLLLWAHVLTRWIVLPTPQLSRVGLAGVAFAGALLLLAACEWLVRREDAARSGPGVLAPSAAVSLYLGILSAIGDNVAAPLCWAGGAWALALLADRWTSGGMRAASYVLVFTGACTSFFVTLHGKEAIGVLAGTGLLLAAGAAGGHYRWLRRSPAPSESYFFRTVDRGDNLRVLVLLAAVLWLLQASQALIRPLLSALTPEVGNAATCILTVTVNLAALALLAFGQRRGDAELRGLGVFLMVVGAGKVFLYDLIAAAGLPLVGSVLSFGVSAGLGATILRKRPGEEEPSPAERGEEEDRPKAVPDSEETPVP